MTLQRFAARAARAARGAAITLAIAGATACNKKAADTSAATPAVVQIGTENIAVLQLADLTSGPSLSGNLAPVNEAVVRAALAGAVLQTYVDKGQPVKRGQLVARIDDSALRETLLSAQSALRAAQLGADNANHDYERNQRLQQAGAIADRDLEGANRGKASALAQLADAQSRFANADKQMTKTRIVAPFSGTVSERPASAGDVVQPGNPIVTIVDPTAMRLEASVPSNELSAVKIGTTVQFAVNGYPDKRFTGKITRINPTADPQTRQVRVYATVPNQGAALVGGLFAQGRVASDTRRGLAAPASAIDDRGLSPAVYRVRGGKVEKMTVQLGLRDEQTERVEIVSGAVAGDTLLLGTAQAIAAGTPVKIVTTNDRTAAGRTAPQAETPTPK
ncbi:MAG: efflux RND transporter periplasmic adaptor subunit [Gemmatimonadaceae bacterium]